MKRGVLMAEVPIDRGLCTTLSDDIITQQQVWAV